MPTRPPRACAAPGCPRLVTDTARCPEHEKARHRAIDERRGSSTERGYGSDWQRFRAWWLSQHPLCVECEREGRVEVATDVDHVVSIAEAPERRLDPTNVRSLCHRHHSARTMRDQVPRRSR